MSNSRFRLTNEYKGNTHLPIEDVDEEREFCITEIVYLLNDMNRRVEYWKASYEFWNKEAEIWETEYGLAKNDYEYYYEQYEIFKKIILDKYDELNWKLRGRVKGGEYAKSIMIQRELLKEIIHELGFKLEE